MSNNLQDSLLILPGAGEQSNTHLVVKVHADRLGGDYSVMEGVMKPRSLLAPHTHANEDQVVIVLNGRLIFCVGDDGETFEAPTGSYVIKPRKIAHTFWNPDDEPVRYVELSGGAGFQGFIDLTNELGAVEAARQSVDALDMQWHYDRIPKLMLANGLTNIAGVSMPWDKLKEGSAEDVIGRVKEALKEFAG